MKQQIFLGQEKIQLQNSKTVKTELTLMGYMDNKHQLWPNAEKQIYLNDHKLDHFMIFFSDLKL